MNNARVVIGSGFGDEGKGLVTDYHASGTGALVVRFNGGAQAGHTVMTPHGRRHVFGHAGSGSFVGAPTYLSRHFACHPMVFASEIAQLSRLGLTPEILVDRNCPVTTPFDVMINQALERARDGRRHGSCGIGFGETLERQQVPEFALSASELEQPDPLRAKLREIRDRYVPSRLAAVGLGALPRELMTDEIVERYVEDCCWFSRRTRLTDSGVLRAGYELVFEGAQGLLLDMDRGAFPHVTRSNTGLRNVVDLARGAGVAALDVSYVSRWYATRHGAGPMRYERATAPLADLVDRTNRPNSWQGGLRFGLLDTDALIEAARADLEEASSLRVRHEWVMTWADKAPGRFAFVAGGAVQHGGIEEVAARLAAGTGACGYRLVRGEHRDHVSDLVPCQLARAVA